MTLNKSSQLVLAAAASLLAASLLAACGSTLTTDFVFVASSRAAGVNNYGELDVFEVNSESGHMRQIPTSPFPSGGRNPVAEAVSTDHNNLYVVNRDDNTIVQFVIGNDGKLYPTSTVNTPGVFPIAVAVAGSNLFVADTYQPLPTCSPAAPCSGSIGVFNIAPSSKSVAGGGLTEVTNGALTYWPLALPSSPGHVLMPAAIAANGSALYVAAYDTSVTPHSGYLFAFATASNGALSALNGGVPYPAGVQPSAIAVDPSGANLYLTDYITGSVLPFAISAGGLTPGVQVSTGDQPSALAVDATGKYVFVTNSLDSTLQVYSASAGVLKSLGVYATGSQPVAVGVDPSTNQYIYTANFLGNNVSGFAMTAGSSTLLNSQNSPYLANAQPTAVAAIPHGSKK
ncbi:MAG: beta-propeller fold lactonase family protein [Terracidiphilus sp.]